MLRRRTPAIYECSHKREIVFDPIIFANEREIIDTDNIDCIQLPEEMPQLGFRIQLYKYINGTVDIKIVVFYAFLAHFLFLGLENQNNIMMQSPPVIVPQKRRWNDKLITYIIFAEMPVEILVGKKMQLIFVQISDPCLTEIRTFSFDDFTQYVGKYMEFRNWSLASDIGSFLDKIWLDAMKNQVVRKNYEDLEYLLSKNGKFQFKCPDDTYVTLSFRRLKRISVYFRAYESFMENCRRLRLSKMETDFDSKVLKIFGEFMYTARLSTLTCYKLFNDPQLLAECLTFSGFYMSTNFAVYLRFILTWKIISYPRNPADIFVLYEHIRDSKIKVMADAFLSMASKNKPEEYNEWASRYPLLHSWLKYLEEDNFFVTKFQSDKEMCWNV
jgi:hypothetical protein